MEQHLSTLVTDLAIILATGGFVTLIFRKVKLPVVLGYILAGFLISPNLGLVTISDSENIKTLAEIGVIFLLFGLGLEFSFKKLARVGGSATITAMVEIVLIALAGYVVGKWLGWSEMDCIFLGGMLASSSTTIIIRAFDELGIKNKPYAKVVFGVLVVEDIVVIMLMVMLSTIAVTKNIEGGELIMSVITLMSFIVAWLVLGIYVIPTVLKRIKNWLDDEAYLVVSIGLCLLTVFIAVKVGFSAELGAFIMGSILAETTAAEKIEEITKPVKDLFSVIFFVSIGMMINIATIFEYGWIVLAITVLVIVGKIVSTVIGALISGQSLQQSIQVGMSMAQIGEFSFIVATLGMSLGVISEFLFPVAVAVSVLTTLTTPFLIKYSEKACHIVERFLPEKIQSELIAYSVSAKTVQAEKGWKDLYKSYAKIVFTNVMIIAAIMLFIYNVLPVLQSRWTVNGMTLKLIALTVTLVACSPFIWAAMFKMPQSKLSEDGDYIREIDGILIARVLAVFFIIGFFVYNLFLSYHSIIIILSIFAFMLYLTTKQIKKLHDKMALRFMTNYHERENPVKSDAGIMIKKEFIEHARSSWDIMQMELKILQDVEYVGKTISELSWRREYGINIIYIERGKNLIYPPSGNDKLLSFDHVGIIATSEQIEKFLPVFNKKIETPYSYSDVSDITVQKFVIDIDCPLTGLKIIDSGIRERTDGQIIGIERGEKQFQYPDPYTILEVNDIIWIAGIKNRLEGWDKLPKEEDAKSKK